MAMLISLLNLLLPLSIESLETCFIKKISVKEWKLRAKPSLGSQKAYQSQLTTKIKHIESIAN